ncbi:MAG TPA: glycosyltransferase family 4 protein [Candidatus Krumholzibacteria bacterium]|nr:glycosyltransferase family 4 protein [Candidatus Krumholzibacteria bacterium]
MSRSPAEAGSDTGAAEGGERGAILIVSPWETVWSLGGGSGVKAGVSDDDRFIDGFIAAGYRIHFLRPRSSGHDPRVHTHAYPNFFRATRALPTALRRPLWPLLFNLIVAPRALRLARRTGARFVLGHSHYSTLTTWLLRKRLGIPGAVKLFGVMDLVHTEWPTLRYRFKNLEQLAALRFAQDAWIVLDDGTRGGDILRQCGVPAERIHFLPNGLDLQWLERPVDRDRARGRRGIACDAHVALFLARLVPSKRPLDFVQAAAELRRRGNEGLVFMIAGDGPERAACERAAREYTGADQVRFLGTVPHDEVPDLMTAADVFVSTSTLTNRALPTCEAMICGVPVIAYDTGDTATVVRPGETGAVVADGDVVALADAIELLLESDSVRERMGEAARRLARETFVSWEARIAMELRIVEELLATRPQTR